MEPGVASRWSTWEPALRTRSYILRPGNMEEQVSQLRVRWPQATVIVRCFAKRGSSYSRCLTHRFPSPFSPSFTRLSAA